MIYLYIYLFFMMFPGRVPHEHLQAPRAALGRAAGDRRQEVSRLLYFRVSILGSRSDFSHESPHVLLVEVHLARVHETSRDEH